MFSVGGLALPAEPLPLIRARHGANGGEFLCRLLSAREGGPSPAASYDF